MPADVIIDAEAHHDADAWYRLRRAEPIGGGQSISIGSTYPLSRYSLDSILDTILDRVSGGSDLVTLIKRVSTWQDVSGAPSKLPSRISNSALSTIALVGATAGIILNLSGGGGQGTGNLPAGVKVQAGSGTQVLAVIDGSGSYVTGGTGALATGVTTPGTNGYKTGKFYADPLGNVVMRGSGSGKTLHGSDGITASGAVPPSMTVRSPITRTRPEARSSSATG